MWVICVTTTKLLLSCFSASSFSPWNSYLRGDNLSPLKSMEGQRWHRAEEKVFKHYIFSLTSLSLEFDQMASANCTGRLRISVWSEEQLYKQTILSREWFLVGHDDFWLWGKFLGQGRRRNEELMDCMCFYFFLRLLSFLMFRVTDYSLGAELS